MSAELTVRGKPLRRMVTPTVEGGIFADVAPPPISAPIAED